MQTNVGHEVQSLELFRREGELELAQRLSAMENIAVQADHLRVLEATKAQDREATLSMLFFTSQRDVQARNGLVTVCGYKS